MIPDSGIFTEDLSDLTYPNDTYKIDVSVDSTSRIDGYLADDGLESVKQAIYLILNTERYQHNIYSWDYGIELEDLIGKPIPYVLSEIPRRVEEALTQDDRILKVDNFEFETYKGKVSVSCLVTTSLGDLETTLEVSV